ncbi:hypothetical protein [Variovorax sp. WS11]|uniref:hypothetical protein n=1 Tax=Variovorax sp. WS11 TaxID=1105204 RepID=UPI0011B226F5|nr:hypothetical protein [Variovorax sp. WS11]NDZ14711.1 hypothetical protein [Variovorax sp. WS11]
MEQARISVDFNEMLAPDLVLLSKTDIRTNSAGETILLREGLQVHVYEADSDADGKPNNLIADGAVERNVSSASWAVAAKWCCRINKDGIRHEVERQSGAA